MILPSDRVAARILPSIPSLAPNTLASTAAKVLYFYVTEQCPASLMSKYGFEPYTAYEPLSVCCPRFIEESASAQVSWGFFQSRQMARMRRGGMKWDYGITNHKFSVNLPPPSTL